jgi:hypothetical protein
MKQKLIILFTLALATSFVQADTFCSEAETFKPLVIAEESVINCDEISSIDQFGGEVLALSPVAVSFPSLKITNEHLKKSVNTGSGVIMKLTSNFDSSKDQQAVFAHELGHTIFDSYFYNNFAPSKKLKELVRQIKAEFTPMIKLLDKNGECTSIACKDVQNSFPESLKLMVQERDEMEDRLELTLDYLAEFVRPYNELVGDAVAVLYFEDPSVMELTLRNVNPGRGSKNVKCRNFLIDVSGVYNKSDHCAFSGLRQKIYNTILLPGIETNTKREALDKLLKLVTSEIEKLYDLFLKGNLNIIKESDVDELQNRNYVTELNSLMSLLNHEAKKTCK